MENTRMQERPVQLICIGFLMEIEFPVRREDQEMKKTDIRKHRRRYCIRFFIISRSVIILT